MSSIMELIGPELSELSALELENLPYLTLLTLASANIDQSVLIVFVYLSSLPVAHLSDAPRRRLVVTGESARIQDETTENSAWFFNVLGV